MAKTKMFSRIAILLFVTVNLFAVKNLDPSYVYTATGGVTDIVMQDNKIYVSTQSSSVDVFDLETKKLIKKIIVPKIEDFMGDIDDAKVYNVDIYQNNILLIVQSTSGFRELYIYKNNKLTKMISDKDKFYISKAKFIDDRYILFSVLGNTMYLYNYRSNQIKWSLDIKAPEAEFNSTFTDFVLSEDKKIAIVADESGDLKVVDIDKVKIVKVLSGKNLDKVFKVDLKNNKVITAGQDGRSVIYDLKQNSSYTIREKHWFLIYGAGLSPTGRLGAYSIDQENNVIVFDTSSKEKKFLLHKNLMTLSSILFISENEVFITTDSNKFNYYNLK